MATGQASLLRAGRGQKRLNTSDYIFFEALQSDRSDAPSSVGLEVEGSPVPLGSTEPHGPIALQKGLWMMWKSLPLCHISKQNKAVGINGHSISVSGEAL